MSIFEVAIVTAISAEIHYAFLVMDTVMNGIISTTEFRELNTYILERGHSPLISGDIIYVKFNGRMNSNNDGGWHTLKKGRLDTIKYCFDQ